MMSILVVINVSFKKSVKDNAYCIKINQYMNVILSSVQGHLKAKKNEVIALAKIYSIFQQSLGAINV